MRFIFNFIFFGLLFYILWLYFPEAFATLVGWVTKLFDFLKNLVIFIVDRVSSLWNKSAPPTEAPKALLLAVAYLFERFKVL